MREITKQATQAFLNRVNFHLSNTAVKYNEIENTSYLYLFDNLIARLKHTTKELLITTCGWNSVTTRERLNGLPKVSVTQRKGQLFLNGELWNGEFKYIDLK